MSINGSIFNPVIDKAIAHDGTKFMIIENRCDKVLFFSYLILFLLRSGCAKKTTIVLLPDPDGKFGHSDTADDPLYNLQLSQSRVFCISRVLMQKGVDSTYIKSTFHGEEKNTLVKTANNVHEPKNRRVEVVVR